MERLYFSKINGVWTLEVSDLLRFRALGGETMNVIVSMLKSGEMLTSFTEHRIIIRYFEDEACVDVLL